MTVMAVRLLLHRCGYCRSSGNEVDPYRLEVQHGIVYRAVCPAGHTLAIRLQHQPFEILFEMGILAFLDGYFREAVTNFAAALERFLEYYVRVICEDAGIEPELFDHVWAKVGRQSERQLGAYVFLFTLDRGENPPYLANKKIRMRNDVIHQGYIPTPEEALDFGDAVLEILWPLLHYLRANKRKSVSAITMRQAVRADKELGDADERKGYVLQTLVSLVYPNPAKKSRHLSRILRTYEKKLERRKTKGSAGLYIL